MHSLFVFQVLIECMGTLLNVLIKWWNMLASKIEIRNWISLIEY